MKKLQLWAAASAVAVSSLATPAMAAETSLFCTIRSIHDDGSGTLMPMVVSFDEQLKRLSFDNQTGYPQVAQGSEVFFNNIDLGFSMYRGSIKWAAKINRINGSMNMSIGDDRNASFYTGTCIPANKRF